MMSVANAEDKPTEVEKHFVEEVQEVKQLEKGRGQATGDSDGVWRQGVINTRCLLYSCLCL